MSHTRLEQRFCVRPISLDSVLDATRQRMRALNTPRALGELMLEVLVSHAHVQAASLFQVTQHGPARRAFATVGAHEGDLHRHPLVARAVSSRRLVTVLDAQARAAVEPGVLAALPLADATGELQLVLTIQQMPFEAFNAEQLRDLYALAERLTELVYERLRSLRGGPQSRAHSRGRRESDRDAHDLQLEDLTS
jgi:hypothetical protein